MEEDKNPIEDSEEHMTKDKDSTEAQGEARTEDIEVENQHSLMVTIGTAWYARREDTTNTPAEDLVEVKIPTEDPKDHTITDKNPTEAQGEVLTKDREEDVLLNPINMQRRGTV